MSVHLWLPSMVRDWYQPDPAVARARARRIVERVLRG